MNNVQNEGLLNPKPGNPNGYVTKDGMWAAVPWGKKFVILHNGQQIHTANNYRSALTYIKKAMKGKSVSTLDKFL
jgi:hypothetical protein